MIILVVEVGVITIEVKRGCDKIIKESEERRRLLDHVDTKMYKYVVSKDGSEAKPSTLNAFE